TVIFIKKVYFHVLKKLVTILLLIIYSTTSIGATVHMHFCMNKFVGWNLTHNENEKCGKCGMKEDATKKGCCKDEHKQLKIDSDQQSSTIASFINIIHSPILLQSLHSYNFQINKFEKITDTYFHPPPLPPMQKLNILYCTFQI
ncbi:MAG: hypothetical protein LH615_02555, partial [Ferruginibacter sp.]|nr:hypothetical protein [Ferruginibacter sp.]